MEMNLSMRALAVVLQHEWATRPRFVFSGIGFKDEHIQVFHPGHPAMPCYTILPNGVVEQHPDHPV